MKTGSLHPSDQLLVLFLDGELRRLRAARVRDHLAACEDCRGRMANLAGAMDEFIQVHRQALDPRLPPIDIPRANFGARLAELERSSLQKRRASLLSPQWVPILASVFALALMIVFGASLLRRHATKSQRAAAAASWMLPNPELTPGAMAATSISTICSMTNDEVVAPVTRGLKKKVFEEYGIAGDPTANYEVDYLITPGLGGTGDIRNLWPEPRYNTVWNSFVKDQLEQYLHQSVCDGSLSLATAQHEIVNNWIAAYKKYFHTNRPLPPRLASRMSDSSVSAASAPLAGDKGFTSAEAEAAHRRAVRD